MFINNKLWNNKIQRVLKTQWLLILKLLRVIIYKNKRVSIPRLMKTNKVLSCCTKIHSNAIEVTDAIEVSSCKGFVSHAYRMNFFLFSLVRPVSRCVHLLAFSEIRRAILVKLDFSTRHWRRFALHTV